MVFDDVYLSSFHFNQKKMSGFKPAQGFFFPRHIMRISTNDITEKINILVTKPSCSGVSVFSSSNFRFHREGHVPRVVRMLWTFVP